MKNKLQPTRTSFSRNFQYKKPPRWLSKFFHFGTENRADQLKKPPCMFVICVRFASSKHKFFVPVHICICLVLLCRRAQGHQDCGWVTFCYKVWQHRCSVCEKYFKHSLCHHAITCGDMGQHVLFLQFFLGYIICNLQFILQCYSNFRRHLFENLKKR